MPSIPNSLRAGLRAIWKSRPVVRVKRMSLLLLRKVQSPRATWSAGRAAELRWWATGIDKLAAGEGSLRQQLDPASVLDDSVADFLPCGEHVHILDVGAGPLTRVGKTSPGRTIKITATDALAGDYDKLLADASIDPPVRTILCETEQLTAKFPLEAFDVVHARNTLDHHYNAEKALLEMLAVLRIGGTMVLWHHENEGERAGYHGMHQFNFTIEAGKPIVWNARTRIEIDDLFGGRAERLQARLDNSIEDKTFVHVVYRKLA